MRRGRRSKSDRFDQRLSSRCQVAGVAEVEGAVGKEAGVSAVAEGDVVHAHDERERAFIGRHVEVVDAGDELIVLRCVTVRAFGLDEAAIGENIGTEADVAEADGGVGRNRQLDEESERAMVGREFDVKTEPGIA